MKFMNDFCFNVNVGPAMPVGDGPNGTRIYYAISDGDVNGTRIKGKIRGGGEWALIEAHRLEARQRPLYQLAVDPASVDPGRSHPGAQPEAEPFRHIVPDHPFAVGGCRRQALSQHLAQRPSFFRHRSFRWSPCGHPRRHPGDPLDISGTTVRTIEKARKRGGKPDQLRPHGPLETRANPGRIRDSRRSSRPVLRTALHWSHLGHTVTPGGKTRPLQRSFNGQRSLNVLFIIEKSWCRRQDLNPQPPAYKADALPVELRRRDPLGFLRGFSDRSKSGFAD